MLRSTNESLYTLFEDLGKSSVGTLKTVHFWHSFTYDPLPGGGRDSKIRLFIYIFDELSNGVSFMGVTILVSEKNWGGRNLHFLSPHPIFPRNCVMKNICFFEYRMK